MSLLERVQAIEDERRGEDDGRVRIGIETLRSAVGEIVPLDRVAAMADESPERAQSDTIFGFGPLDALIHDEAVTEIMVNGTHSVYVERNGRLELASVKFESDDQVRALIDRILGPLGRRIDESSPLVSARLPQGHRVHAVVPPLAIDGPCLTIRSFTRKALSLVQLRNLGSFDETVEQFLVWAVLLDDPLLGWLAGFP